VLRLQREEEDVREVAHFGHARLPAADGLEVDVIVITILGDCDPFLKKNWPFSLKPML
jgi:hypothetical protein